MTDAQKIDPDVLMDLRQKMADTKAASDAAYRDAETKQFAAHEAEQRFLAYANHGQGGLDRFDSPVVGLAGGGKSYPQASQRANTQIGVY